MQQVRRLVAAATAENRNRFAAVLGREPLGDAMGRALAEAARQAGLPPPTIRTIGADFSGLDAAVEAISGYTAPPPATPPAASAGAAAAPAPPPPPPQHPRRRRPSTRCSSMRPATARSNWARGYPKSA